jgi:hypothetical protein
VRLDVALAERLTAEERRRARVPDGHQQRADDQRRRADHEHASDPEQEAEQH